MKNYIKIIISLVVILITTSSVIMYRQTMRISTENKYKNSKYILFFNRYDNDGSNRKNYVMYYDEHMNLIYKENFKASNKVPNQIMVGNAIYSYGYGGVFKTDISTKKTTPLNTETSINIVKYDEFENIYVYQNFGFKNGTSGEYNSKILKNNVEYLQLDYPVVDFCICKDILYVTVYNDIKMQDGKICIYKDKELVSQYNVNLSNGEGCWAIYDNNVFFLSSNFAFMVNITQIQKVDFEGIEQKLAMPQVISNTYFNKLYINSMEVHYKDNKMIFLNKTMNDYRNYNPIKDKTLNCYFNKKEQTLKLNESIITIDNNKKYNYVFLSAFEI